MTKIGIRGFARGPGRGDRPGRHAGARVHTNRILTP